MKFIEEILGGDVFLLESNYFIVSSDFKKAKQGNLRLCISLKDGTSRWLSENILVDPVPIFTIDSGGTIMAIKETKKTDEFTS